ncbi:kinase-like domain-containing protein [Achaetomium macrosporum]|uniref:Kinase-like domain-containing protein n=1 Tax=Achaetomium macrosporum TaxID=79813 RepID=A0AAN7CC45_9PEZI|nr:kinase-like domain-containing protein [Achaetomium macrosporum]
MPNDKAPTVTIYQHYCPPRVKRVMASGMSAFIGEVDDSTVFKYPLAPGGDMTRLEAEKQLLDIIGPHERIIAYKGCTEAGIYLERAVNGNLVEYMLESGEPLPPVKQRLAWCRETAEAVAWIHSRRVLHCDIQPTYLLLDKDLHIKLSDIQGRHLSADGKILIDGWSTESCRFSAPRNDPFDADIKTDLFALGCTFYFIMVGHAVYPDIVDGEEGWHEKVEGRFRNAITMKCWRMEYESAEQVIQDLLALESEQESQRSSGMPHRT